MSLQYFRCFAERHKESQTSRLKYFMQAVFFWFIEFVYTSRKKLLEVWTTRSGVINCQSYVTTKNQVFRCTPQGIADV